MLRNLTIARKLTWLNVLVSAIALLLASSGFIAYDQITFRGGRIRGVNALAQVVGSNSVSAIVFNDPDSAAKTLYALNSTPNILAASIFRTDGTLLATYKKEGIAPITTLPLKPEAGHEVHEFIDRDLYMVWPIELQEKRVGVLAVRAQMTDLDDRLVQYLQIAAAVLALSLLGALLASAALRKTIAWPIIQLAAIAKKVSQEKDFSLRATPTKNRDEVSTLVDSFNEMLTQIHSRDSALQQAYHRLSVAQETAKLGDWEWNLDRNQVTLSTEVRRQHAIQDFEGTLDGWMSSVYLDDQERVRSGLENAARNKSQLELDYRTGNAEEHTWVLLKAVSRINEEGSNSLAGVCMDITRLKLAQEALLRSEKLAAAGRLAASVSHEINNPLESVTNLLYLVSNSPNLPPEIAEYVHQAEQELTRVSHIATQTLRFYRQTTNAANADLGSLLDSVLDLLKAKAVSTKVQIMRQYRTAMPLYCYEGELRQVFTNLIGNSLDAMTNRGGKLLLRTSLVHLWSREGTGIRVSIADTGPGMSGGTLNRIFEPFYSTKGSRGTGLGLWISKEIAVKHNAIMKVRSMPGQGTVFTIVFPLDGLRRSRASDQQQASA